MIQCVYPSSNEFAPTLMNNPCCDADDHDDDGDDDDVDDDK